MNPNHFSLTVFLMGILSFFSPLCLSLSYLFILESQVGSDHQEKAIPPVWENGIGRQKPLFYCWYFCYFPPHWVWSGLAWKDHVHH